MSFLANLQGKGYNSFESFATGGDVMDRKDKGQLFAAFGMVGTIGLHMAVSVAVGLTGGRFLDNWLGTSPWATVAGIVLGMIAGLYGIYKQVIGK